MIEFIYLNTARVVVLYLGLRFLIPQSIQLGFIAIPLEAPTFTQCCVIELMIWIFQYRFPVSEIQTFRRSDPLERGTIRVDAP